MAENEFMLKLVAMLDQSRSKKQINSQIKELEKGVRTLRLTATLAKGTSKQQLNQTIRQIEGQLNHIKLKAKIDQKNLKNDMNKALQSISFKDIDAINIDSSKTKLKVQKAIADVKKVVRNNPILLNIDLKRDKLNNQLTTYVSKNTKIRESESLLKQVDSLRNKISGINDSDSLRNVTQEFQLFKSECAATGYQVKSASDRIKRLIGNVTKIGSAFGVASLAVSNFQKSLKTIKIDDSILTEISKTSNMTKAQLAELGNQSFDVGSKYGRLSKDYLIGVQEMARSGYETASKGMAELSLMAQSAGDMTADVANSYIIATDNAYKFNGEMSKLNAVLDGQNAISNANSVALQDMAEGMSKAGTVASSYRVSIEDLSAMIGTIESVTKLGGSEVGNGIKAILINLQNVTSDKIVDTLDKANASMTEFVNGTEKLRNPINIIRDLAKTFNQLDEDDPLRAEILTNIGGKYQAAKLGALLQNMEMFDKMLMDYSNGAGSALEEANKSANSLEGRLNALQNSWDELVNSITNKSAIKGGVSFLDTLLQSATKLIDTFNMLPVALASFTAFTTAKNKDVGISQLFSEDGKFDVQGNFMGINFTQIKHFKEAEKAIAGWNKEVLKGKIDIKDFNSEVVKNNTQLREYLSTCTDGSASLKGYKQSLQAAGEATNELRLSTILLNTALSFAIGLAIQGIISGLDYLIHKEEKAAEALKESKDKFSETTNEIKSLNDELTSTQDKIKELQKLADNGTISVADENELKILKKTNDELERKIALKQKEQIDDAKKLLKNVQKNNKEKSYSYAHYDSNGKYITERKRGDASEQLEDTIKQYQDAVKYYGKGNVNTENYNKTITEQAEKVGNLIEAYESLKDAGIKLTEEQQEEYNSAIKAQDAYLLFSYNLNKTKEGFKALNKEQKKSILNDRLLEQGLTEQEIKVVLKYIPEEDLDDFYDLDFDFPLPDRKDYKTVEEYGKAYAEAWKNGIKAKEENLSGDEPDTPLSLSDRFKNLWDSESFKDAKENLEKISKESKITANDIYSLAKENETLSSLLDESGMSAQFAAECFDSMCRGGKGFDAVTSDALLLDQVLDGMTASLQHAKAAKSSYDEAMSKDDYNTEFKNYQEAYASAMEMFKNGEYGRHFRDTMQYLLGEDSFTMSIEELEKACKDLDKVFGKNATNGYEFLDRLYSKKDILDGLDSSLTRLSDGTYKFDLKPDEFETIADALNMTTEEVAACTNALGMFGDYRSYDLDELELAMNAISIAAKDGKKSITSLQGVKNILKDLGKSDYEIAGIIQDIRDMGTVKLVDFEEGNVDKIISKLKELELISIDGKNINLDSLISGLKQMGNSGTDIAGFIERLNGQFNLTDAQGKLVDFETAKNQALSVSENEASEEMSKVGENAESSAEKVSDLGTEIDNVNSKSLSQVKLQFADVSTAAINAKNKVQDIIDRINDLNNTKISISTSSDSSDTSGEPSEKPSGKKGYHGTVGSAFSKGTFDEYDDLPVTGYNGLPRDEKNALRSEYGQPELTVYPDGKTELTTKPTMGDLPKGTVIFNEKQTKKIMDGNRKTSGNAYASGTVKKPSTSSSGSESKTESRSTKKSTKKSSKKTKKATEEIFDWIERRIKKFQRKFDKWLKQAETAVTRGFINKYYKKAAAAAKNELSTYGKAYNRYMKKASAVGLDKKYRDKVKNGTIDIQSIKDEKLAEKIKKYQEYYDKAQEATASFVETAEKLYNLPLDKAASKIEKFSDAIDLLDKKLDNAVGSKAKNKIIDKQTKEEKKTLDAYKEANKKTKKNLKSAGEELTKSKNLGKDDGITAREKKKIKEAVKNGKEVDLAYFKVGSAGYKAAVKYNEALKANTKSAYDLQSAQEDYKSWLSDASMQKFENIQSQYESELSLMEHSMDMVDTYISKAEALGHVVSGSYYKSLMSQEQENIRTLTKERDDLQKTLDAGLKDGSIKKYSDKWYEMKDAINGVTKSINEATVSVIEYRNQLRQLEWDKFDRQQDYISQIQSESDFLADLMGSEKMFDDNGAWTKYADATAGLYAVSYNAYMSQADDYAKELAKIEKELAKDPYNTDLISRKQELIKLQQESIKNAENEKASIKSLVSDGYSALLDAVKKIVDEYKDALSAQKDLYDYEKSIAKQTKNISTLEKQALSLEGDDSEETRAKLQKIKTELEDARNDLSESEYDRWVKDQEKMLDSITDEMEEWINERLDNIDVLVADVIANTNANSSEINSTIKQVGKDVGYSLTPEMEKIWNTGNGISNIVSMYSENFETGLTTVNSTLESIRDLVQSMTDASDKEASADMFHNIDMDKLKEVIGNSGRERHTFSDTTADSSNKTTASSQTAASSGFIGSLQAVAVSSSSSKTAESSKAKWGSWFKKKKYTGNKGSLNKNGSVIDRLRYLDYDSSLSARKSYYSAMGGKGTYTGAESQNTWMLSEMKKHGFKSGGTIGSLVKGSGEDGFVLARTGEEILSLDKIRELGKAFESINPVIDSINAIVPSPEFTRIPDTDRNSIDNVNIEFTLPNVKNYDEFMSRMRTDKRFEGMVQNMTLGNALGRNSFNKLR